MIGTVRISQLPPAETITGNETLIVNQDGDTRRTTANAIIGIVTSITGIQSTGTPIGTGITTLNFIGVGNTFSVNGGTVNISIPGITNISYASTTRTLSSSTGIGTVLPLVSTSTVGLQAATSFGTITYAATVDLDLAVLTGQVNSITLTGALELTTSNLANGRITGLRLIPGASARDLTFPADWKFVSAKPASLPADKVARLTIECHGTTNADVVAAIAIQP
jgi:hypothetical protein